MKLKHAVSLLVAMSLLNEAVEQDKTELPYAKELQGVVDRTRRSTNVRGNRPFVSAISRSMNSPAFMTTGSHPGWRRAPCSPSMVWTDESRTLRLRNA